MSTQRERMWTAYLDGELSASEAAEFDQSLTADEKELLQGEVRLEGSLSEVLAKGGACPEEVWKRTQETVKGLYGRPARRAIPWWAGVYGVAAVLALTFAGLVYQACFAAPGFLKCDESAASDLIASLEVKADSLTTINEYLHTHGVSLTLTSTHGKSMRRHNQELLGACEEVYAGETVAQLVYECCGKPVKVVIVPKHSEAAAAIRRAIDDGNVQEFRTIGDYLTAAVSNHYAHGLLDMLTEEEEFALLRI